MLLLASVDAQGSVSEMFTAPCLRPICLVLSAIEKRRGLAPKGRGGPPRHRSDGHLESVPVLDQVPG